MLKKLKNNKVARLLLGALTAFFVTFIFYYVTLPPINGHSKEFWSFLAMVFAVYALCLGAFNIHISKSGITFGGESKTYVVGSRSSGKNGLFSFIKSTWAARIGVILILIPIVITIFGGIFSSTVFNAQKYADVITVNEEDFKTDMPEVKEIKNIALLDTESAKTLGTKELGSLSDVISQFVVSEEYTQINFRNQPMKVANLEYDGFFKWLNNKNEGIPGYIMVDAVAFKAKYHELDENMRYAESAYFGKDLMRALRFAYPTKIFDNVSFEVDENGKVFYVVSCATAKVGLFGAMDISEVILFDPVNGSSEIMPVENVPGWIDIVYDGYLACDKYNWNGLYAGGFFNSIIGQKGCKQTTDDFGYLMLNDDVWYFTGVTSVTADESNIGFILSCARTGEYKFYSVIGADENSAMGAAEGEVQEKEYVASFPALVNIAGEPTYITVLKDANRLVKLYALINVEQYNIVATGETQTDTINAYLKLLSQNGVDVSGSQISETVTVKIKDIKFLTLSGSDYAYITAENGKVYRVEFNEENESLVLLAAGDNVKLVASLDEKTGIYSVSEFAPAE